MSTDLGWRAVLAFWDGAGPGKWFAKDAAFDAAFHARFIATHEASARGEVNEWAHAPSSCLALLLLLDQFPRNAFRGTPRMYATDAAAIEVARHAVAAGFDRRVEGLLRLFFYLPFAHSERLEDQEVSVALNRRLGQPWLSHAEDHRNIVKRFGRFPHRNPILGRPSTPEEIAFLAAGGFSG
ncbi:DUF924 family protein [Luteimonas aestuarii]|uniref:DUF924 family protein n=1 Tax=Luteimonas aestuarii TaxID=453837 RepID=UPI001FB5F141|nr:DUF924 family protein [Luteimonas aestuarii]